MGLIWSARTLTKPIEGPTGAITPGAASSQFNNSAQFSTNTVNLNIIMARYQFRAIRNVCGAVGGEPNSTFMIDPAYTQIAISKR